MSRIPTGTLRFSRVSILAASRCASGTPRRRIPMNASRSRSLVFSSTSCARRTSVRSISEALISWAFSRVRDIRLRMTEYHDEALRTLLSTEPRASASGLSQQVAGPLANARGSVLGLRFNRNLSQPPSGLSDNRSHGYRRGLPQVRGHRIHHHRARRHFRSRALRLPRAGADRTSPGPVADPTALPQRFLRQLRGPGRGEPQRPPGADYRPAGREELRARFQGRKAAWPPADRQYRHGQDAPGGGGAPPDYRKGIRRTVLQLPEPPQ